MKVKVLPEPNKPDNISQNSKWLSGLGAGSWFWISDVKEKDVYRICRYSPIGELECDRIFNLLENDFPQFNILESFKFTYISHCLKCTIIQNKNIYIFVSQD